MRNAPAAWDAPAKLSVLGMPISTVTTRGLLALLEVRPVDRAVRVCFCNVHAVMTARREPDVRRALASADVATADGMPLVWALRRLGNPGQERVRGPRLMVDALIHGQHLGWRHYLYGTTEQTLDRLEDVIGSLAPKADVVGRTAPPYRPLTEVEEHAVIADIDRSGADLVWVGLGHPKQELWMQRVSGRLPGRALLGVGAAFDLVSGTVPEAPRWLQQRGLEWAYRLVQEPGRLWRRYIVNNPLFLALLADQLIRHRLRTRGGDEGPE